MHVLILSDTHGRADRVQELLSRPAVRPDVILFAGDGWRDMAFLTLPCPLFAVTGNNDFLLTPIGGQEPSVEQILDIEGYRILVTHGHRWGVKQDTDRLARHGAAQGVDIVIFGHTHCRHEACLPAGTDLGDTVLERPLWLFNPGSLGDRDASFGTLEIRRGQPLFGFGAL